MKIVRESLNEKFTEKSDPVDDMGIGYLNDLQKRFYDRHISTIPFSKMTPNQLLMVGVNHASNNEDVRLELLNYALKQGADQLWRNEEGSSINEIVKIIKVGRATDKNYRPTIKYTIKPVWNMYIGTNITADVIGTSKVFHEKYRPITTRTMKDMDERIKQIEKMKDLINQFNTKIDNPPY